MVDLLEFALQSSRHLLIFSANHKDDLSQPYTDHGIIAYGIANMFTEDTRKKYWSQCSAVLKADCASTISELCSHMVELTAQC